MSFLENTFKTLADPGDLAGKIFGNKGEDTAVAAAQVQSDAAITAAEINAQAISDASNLSSTSALDAANIAAGGAIEGANISAAAQRFAAAAQERAALAAIEEQKRQFRATEKRFQPFVDLGTQFIGDVAQGSTVEGLDQRLSQIFDTDQFGTLFDFRQRAAEGAFATAGLVRSGRAIKSAADISTDLATGIEERLFNRQATNVDRGQNAAAQLGGFGQNFSNAVSDIGVNTAANIGQQGIAAGNLQGGLFADAARLGAQGILSSGNAQAQGIIGSAEATAQGIQQAAQAQAEGILGAREQSVLNTQNLLQIGGTVAAIYFSDERLKENMQPIGQIGDLTLYEWDWNRPIEMGMEMSTGFSAQEVQEKYPQYIYEVNDMLVIDYGSLTDELKQKAEFRLLEVA